MNSGDLDPTASRGQEAVVASAVSVSFAAVVLGLRITTRATMVKNVGPEEYVMVASLVFSIALSILIAIEYKHGQGHHIETISEADIIILLKALWASVPVYQLALTLTKLSILLQYWRVFVNTAVRKVVLVLFVVTTLYGAWSVFGTIFMCMPVSAFWTGNMSNDHCLNKFYVWFTNAGLNIATDIVIFVLPMPVLSQLHLPRRQRMALMFVFGLGAFVCLTSILRLKALYTISTSLDSTWDNSGAAAWSSLEVNIGIICASLPTLRKTISHFLPDLFPSSNQSAASRHYSFHASALQRLPTSQETSMQTRSRPRSDSANVGLNSKIESRLSDNDQASVDEEDHGGIRVVTVTTQHVHTKNDADLEAAIPPPHL